MLLAIENLLSAAEVGAIRDRVASLIRDRLALADGGLPVVDVAQLCAGSPPPPRRGRCARRDS